MFVSRDFRDGLRALVCAGLILGSSSMSQVATAPRAASEPVPATAAAQEWSPIQRTNLWLKRAREGRVRIDADSIEALRVTIGDLRLLWAVHPERSKECAGALLDLMGLAIVSSPLNPSASSGDAPAAVDPPSEVRALAAETLTAHLDTALIRWIAREVLTREHSETSERRLAALDLLRTRHDRETKLALFECARASDPRVRDAALLAMVGWEDDTVHAFFLELLTAATGPDRSGRLTPSAAASRARWAEQHFESVKIGHDSRVQRALVELVKTRLSSVDWRSASQALKLSRALEHEAIVPFLIESMSAWKARGAAGAQALRMQYEILSALEYRSGRSLGLHPENWQLWWAAVQQGDVRGQNPQTFGGRLESTKASFFGVRSRSDRVTFVIDRSGSMNQPFGWNARSPQTKPHTRWHEAVSQLLTFAEGMGPNGRFNIVVFHDYAEVWQPRLAEVNADNLTKAREWLSSPGPGGGTMLLSGIERALMLAPDGTLDVAKLEADTIIVLCDGETAEGPEWVEPFLARVNSVARIIFHGVQIGGAGDGTLKRLADGSGGEFVMSDG